MTVTSSKRSNRRRTNAPSALLALALLAGTAAGCTHFRGGPGAALDGRAACSALDSALAASGLGGGLAMEGKVTIDAEQYRVRGRFTLTLSAGGDLVFEMTSTTAIGGHREDAVFSFYADTLRVLDREHGRYYEGADVGAMVSDALGADLDVAELLRRVAARPLDCARVGALRLRPEGLDGRVDEGAFEVGFRAGRIASAVWPLPRNDRSGRQSLSAAYSWRGGRLTGLTLWVPEERWRIRLTAD